MVVAARGQPTEMKFTNRLGDAAATNVLAYKYGTDQTLHWADPLNGEANMWNHMAMPPVPGTERAENYLGSIPACVHLHGVEVPPQLDGGPDTWMTSDGLYLGHAYYTHPLRTALGNEAVYRYPNSQEGALIWFHCRAALPHLLRTGGCIVTTSSTAALAGLAYGSAYAATKGGIIAYTRALAVEYKRGVRVNCVCPGAVDTPMTQNLGIPDDADFSLIARQLPLTAAAKPEAIAGIYSYLISADAAHMTGEVVRIDGGMLA